MSVKQKKSDCSFNHTSSRLFELIVSRKSLSTEMFLKLEIDGNHVVSDQQNEVDGAFLHIWIQVKQPVRHVTDEQVHCRAQVMAPGATFLADSLYFTEAVCEVSQRSKPL